MRTEKIVESIKGNLDRAGIISEEDEIIAYCNEVQDDIMLKTQVAEKIFTITTVAGQDDYENEIDDCYQIRDIVNITTKRKIDYVPLVSWASVAFTVRGSEPQFVTTYQNTISFAPTPTSVNKIAIVTFQKATKELMSLIDEIEPELPLYCDNAIIQGVLAKFDANRLPLYAEALDSVRRNTSKFVGKRNFHNQTEASW